MIYGTSECDDAVICHCYIFVLIVFFYTIDVNTVIHKRRKPPTVGNNLLADSKKVSRIVDIASSVMPQKFRDKACLSRIGVEYSIFSIYLRNGSIFLQWVVALDIFCAYFTMRDTCVYLFSSIF